jgi:hypothetical protein
MTRAYFAISFFRKASNSSPVPPPGSCPSAINRSRTSRRLSIISGWPTSLKVGTSGIMGRRFALPVASGRSCLRSFYFTTPQATRAPEFPAGSDFSSSACA